MLEDDGGKAKVPQKIACSECKHVWAVATIDPMTLAEGDEEEQKAETD